MFSCGNRRYIIIRFPPKHDKIQLILMLNHRKKMQLILIQNLGMFFSEIKKG